MICYDTLQYTILHYDRFLYDIVSYGTGLYSSTIFEASTYVGTVVNVLLLVLPLGFDDYNFTNYDFI